MLSESDAVDDKTLEDHVRGLQRKQVQVSPASHLPPLKKAESPSSSSYGIWVLIGASGDGSQAWSAKGVKSEGPAQRRRVCGASLGRFMLHMAGASSGHPLSAALSR